MIPVTVECTTQQHSPKQAIVVLRHHVPGITMAITLNPQHMTNADCEAVQVAPESLDRFSSNQEFVGDRLVCLPN